MLPQCQGAAGQAGALRRGDLQRARVLRGCHACPRGPGAGHEVALRLAGEEAKRRQGFPRGVSSPARFRATKRVAQVQLVAAVSLTASGIERYPALAFTYWSCVTICRV
jgi:hypothetical protein